MEELLNLIGDHKILTALAGFLVTYGGAEIMTWKSKLKGKTIIWSYIIKPIWENAILEYEEGGKVKGKK